jgi:MFS family permease
LLLSGVPDLLGSRRTFIAGSTLLTLGTLMVAGADNQGLLVAGRLVKGAGAASALGGATGVMVGAARRFLRLVIGVPRHRASFGRCGRPAPETLEEGPIGARRRLDGRGAVTITVRWSR